MTVEEQQTVEKAKAYIDRAYSKWEPALLEEVAKAVNVCQYTPEQVKATANLIHQLMPRLFGIGLTAGLDTIKNKELILNVAPIVLAH